MILACFFFEFGYGNFLNAQTETVDSLNRALYITINSDQRISILNRMALELKQQDPVRSREIAEDALDLAKKSNNKEEIVSALITEGYIFNSADEYSMALNKYLEALNICMELNRDADKSRDIAQLHYQIGSLYKTLGNYQKAIENCLAGLKMYEGLNDKNGIALIYRVMGSIYKYKGEYEKSLFYYFNGLRINEEEGNLPQVANSFNNIGVVYFTLKNYDQALRYYKKSLEINLSKNIESEAAINIGNIGVVYLEKNKLDSAFFYFNKRYNSALQQNDKKGMTISFQSFGDYYFRKAEYSGAIEYYNKALQLSREIGIMETSKNLYKSLSDLYEKNLDYNKAFTCYKLYISLRDSLLNSESLQKIEQMEQEYALEKERTSYFLSQQKNKIYRISGFSALILSILFLILIYLNQNIKLKQKNLEQKNLEIDKKQLQNEVYYKDKDLVSKAINLAEKNELLEDIMRRLKGVILDPKGANNEVKEIIKDLRFHSDTHLWDEFEFTFLQVHPEYYSSLGKRFPELTPNERRLSAFLRLNLTTKEISNITHQSLHSLTVARTRLRKKLGIAHSGENLASFLSQF